MKTIFTTLFILVFSFTISAQKSKEVQAYCTTLTNLISYYSTVEHELISSKALFNEEENPPCFMNAIMFYGQQNSSNFYAELQKCLKESGIPKINILKGWTKSSEDGIYFISWKTISEGYELVVFVVYNIGQKGCSIRVL